MRHAIEVPDGIVVDLCVEVRVDDQVGTVDQQRVAVRRRLRRSDRSDIPAGAAKIFDVELRPDLLGQLLRHQTREHIGRTAGSERNDDTHRPHGIALCTCKLCHQQRCCSCARQQQHATAKNHHGVVFREVRGGVRVPPAPSAATSGRARDGKGGLQIGR